MPLSAGDKLGPYEILAPIGAVGRDAEAEEHFHQAMHLDPSFFWSYDYLAGLYAGRGKFAEALPIAVRSISLVPDEHRLYAGMLVRAGQAGQGKELAQELGPGETNGAPTGRALFHTCCDEIDLAADWYETAIGERDSLVYSMLQSAMGEPVRASSRWPKLAALMNLPVRT
jgi:hypothetical protein